MRPTTCLCCRHCRHNMITAGSFRLVRGVVKYEADNFNAPLVAAVVLSAGGMGVCFELELFPFTLFSFDSRDVGDGEPEARDKDKEDLKNAADAGDAEDTEETEEDERRAGVIVGPETLRESAPAPFCPLFGVEGKPRPRCAVAVAGVVGESTSALFCDNRESGSGRSAARRGATDSRNYERALCQYSLAPSPSPSPKKRKRACGISSASTWR
ncbi:hypothetical protein C8R45DRAFT_1005425 [Mycena sanguinolenta]|nr:hypothetical protein C8R45DRAFT_1005425 [Mycena sanguinolenta]